MWKSWSLTGNGPDVQTAGNEDVFALIGPSPRDNRVKKKRGAGVLPRHSDTEIRLQATPLVRNSELPAFEAVEVAFPASPFFLWWDLKTGQYNLAYCLSILETISISGLLLMIIYGIAEEKLFLVQIIPRKCQTV